MSIKRKEMEFLLRKYAYERDVATQDAGCLLICRTGGASFAAACLPIVCLGTKNDYFSCFSFSNSSSASFAMEYEIQLFCAIRASSLILFTTSWA